MNAVLLSAIITIALASIYIGSADAYNAIVGISRAEIANHRLTRHPDIPRCVRSDGNILHLDLMRVLQEDRATRLDASNKMESGKIRHSHQRRLYCLRLDCILLPFLAKCYASRCSESQLRAGCLYARIDYRHAVLCFQSKASLQGTCLLH